MMVIAIIDYNMGNLHSVYQALRHISPENVSIQVTSDPAIIEEADKVVFPGQGAARDCMREITEHGLTDAIREAAATKPFLGICMGMQVLMQYSEENQGVDCLNILEGRVNAFTGRINQSPTETRLKVPHMGWNQIKQTLDHPLWAGIADNSYFYFVHSYYLELENAHLMAGQTEYGVPYPSVIAKDNIFALQPHPEKSAEDGLKLLSNFVHWDGR